jgi:hypothetical protein
VGVPWGRMMGDISDEQLDDVIVRLKEQMLAVRNQWIRYA